MSSVRNDLMAAFEAEDYEHVDGPQLVHDGDAYADDNPLAAKTALEDEKNAEAEEAAKIEAEDDDDAAPAATDDDKEPAAAAADDPAPELAEAPVRWTKEDKETWEALRAIAGEDKEAQNVVAKAMGILGSRNKQMESGLTQRFQELAAERAQFQETSEKFSKLDSVIAPYRSDYQRMGTDEVAILQQTLALEKHARDNPEQFMTWFAQQRGYGQEQIARMFGIEATPGEREVVVVDENYNVLHTDVQPINPQQRQHAAQQQPGAAQADAGMHPQLRQYLDGLNREIAELKVGAQSYQQQQMASFEQSADQMLTEFSSATDESGQPAHPFFQDVRADMGAILTANPNYSLEQAYNAAVHARPDLSAQVWESREIAIRRQQEQAQRNDAQKARRASASLPTSSVNVGAPPPSGKSRSIRDELAANVSQYMSDQDFL